MIYPEEYNNFLKEKEVKIINGGFNADNINEKLYDFQKDIVKWSIKKGKSAIFADCGLGKTPIQLEWANKIFKKENKSILIFAPLAVSKQTIREGLKFGVKVVLAESQEDIKNGIYITNYEKLHKFTMDNIIGIVLDESSILKSYSGKFRTEIIERTKHIPYKLCCTATPAPNDFMELGNHSEFLDVMTRKEMLSMFFIHDSAHTQGWRLKGYAENQYWKWLSTWAIVLRKPSDLDYDDNGFILPKINFYEHIVKCEKKNADTLFTLEAQTLQERQRARADTINDRIKYIADKINTDDNQWLIWCNLNKESDEIGKQIKDSITISGSDKEEYKENSMMDFSDSKIKRMITKPKIAGFGMNWQNCNNMAFVGLSDSYEQFYQAVRRCWRFGQKKEVNVHIVISEAEGEVMKNIKRKEHNAEKMYNNMIEHMKNFSISEVKNIRKNKEKYMSNIVESENYKMIMGDCVEEVKKIESNSVGYSIFSPPFAELYTYSDSERDMGNSKNYNEFFKHFKYLIKDLYRILMPGRLVSFHCIDIPAMKERDGYIGLKDFPADLIRNFQEEGFIYHSRHIIWKDPLIEATRTKALGLMHKQLCKDSSMCRAGLPDYIITMRKEGNNENFISHKEGIITYFGSENPIERGIEYSHMVWRKYASPVWMDIRQGNTLNKNNARGDKDEKHICPLQLDTIGRCLTLWSNKNDIIFSPFAGIGSEGYQALLMNRKFIGIELKESYFNEAVKNLQNADKEKNQEELFK